MLPDLLNLPKHLREEGPAIKSAPYSFGTACFIILVVCITVCSSLFYWHYRGIVETRDGTIIEKNATIEKQRTALDLTEKDNARLREDIKSGRQYSSLPLKRRVEILSQQLLEFASDWERGAFSNNPAYYLGDSWNLRFRDRIRNVRTQLDDMGKHSEELDKLVESASSSADIRKLATELRKIAESLPDDTH
jgi:hypothetical protein